MKGNMKKIVKGMGVIAIVTAVIFGSVAVNPIKAEAKGTAFIKKKVSSVTPTIKSAKRSKGRTTITVSIPTSKVKKLGKSENLRAEIAYGSTKNSKKFEAKKLFIYTPKKKGKNSYVLTVGDKDLASYKNAYITVRFYGKSNWSKLVKVSGKATKPKYKMPKRDKDGTYTTAIYKRFNQGYKFNEEHYTEAYRGNIGVWSDNDGWIYVKGVYSKCAKCGKVFHPFTDPETEKMTQHREQEMCWGNCINGLECIAFDEVTGKVVNGNPEALKDYPIGTFFMDVY